MFRANSVKSFYPQEGIHRLYLCVSRPVRTAFLSAFFTGILMYGFAMFNICISEGDALYNTVFNGNLDWLGRWSSKWLSALSTSYSIPSVSVGITILALSFVSAFAASLFNLKYRFSAVFCGIVLMGHPAVESILQYWHNTDAYSLAALFGIAAVWLADQKPFKFWFLVAVPLLTLGTATYQATLSFAGAMMALAAFSHILFDKRSDQELARTALRYVLLFVAALACYYLGVRISLRSGDILLTDYHSVSSMGQFSLSDLLRNFFGCYQDYKNSITFISFRPEWYISGYPNYLLAVLSVFMLILGYALCKKRSILRTVVFALMIVLMPVLFCSIRLTNPGTVETRMTYSMAAFFLLPVICYDRLYLHSDRFAASRVSNVIGACGGIASILAVLCLCIAIFGWSVGSNLDFYRGRTEYTRMASVCSKYVAIAEQTDGYEPDMPIYIAGNGKPKYYYAFMHYFLGIRMPYGIANDIDAAVAEIMKTEEFQNLPCYPAEGSSALIEGNIVIKLGE